MTAKKNDCEKGYAESSPCTSGYEACPPHPQGRTVKLSHDWRFLSRQPKQEQLQLAEAFVNPVPSGINLGVAPPLRQGLCTFCICQKDSCIKPHHSSAYSLISSEPKVQKEQNQEVTGHLSPQSGKLIAQTSSSQSVGMNSIYRIYKNLSWQPWQPWHLHDIAMPNHADLRKVLLHIGSTKAALQQLQGHPRRVGEA